MSDSEPAETTSPPYSAEPHIARSAGVLHGDGHGEAGQVLLLSSSVDGGLQVAGQPNIGVPPGTFDGW